MSTEKPWKDEDMLRELYEDRQLSTTEIAEEFGCTNTTISRWLDKHGIETRGPGGAEKIDKLRDQEWLREEYKKKKRTTTDIADELETTHGTVLNWLEKHNIDIRTGGSKPVEKLRNSKWLRRKYIHEEKTTAQIAEELECSDVAVSDWLNRHNINTRFAGPEPITEIQDKNWLQEKYQELGLSAPEIGEQLDCGTTTVYRWLDRHNIDRTDPVEKLRDREWLREQYCKEGKTASEIATISDTSPTSVFRWLRKHQIETREGGISTPSELQDETWLREEYINRGRSVHDIAEELRCASSTVANWIQRHGMRSRTGGPERIDELRDEDWLREQYENHKKTADEIASELECTSTTVTYWLHNHGINTRPAAFPSGPDNPSYVEGTTDALPFGENWEKQRQKARERDNYVCQRCGKNEEDHKEIHGTELHVHHITPRIEFFEEGDIDGEKANSLNNLITLCVVCHMEIEGLPVDFRPECTD